MHKLSAHGNFLVVPEILDSNIVLSSTTISVLVFHTVVEYIEGLHDKGKMLVPPNQLLS